MLVRLTQVTVGLLLTGFALYGQAAYAATYYVAKTGRDTNSCAQAQSQSTPKLTINDGVRCLAAGDTLYVYGGTYDESLVNNVPSGSSWSSAVRIAAYPGETVTMQPSSTNCTWGAVVWLSQSQQYIELDGINLDGRNCRYFTVKFESGAPPATSTTYDPHHIRIKNAELTGSDNLASGESTIIVMVASGNPSAIGHNEFINLTLHRGPAQHTDYRTNGFYFNTPDNLVDGCDIYDMLGFGIQIYINPDNMGGTPDRTIVRNTRIHDFPARQSSWISTVGHNSGIVDATGSNAQIYNNLIYNILTGDGAPGIAVAASGASNTAVYNNTVYGGAADGINIASGVSGTIVRNNISYLNAWSNYVDNGNGTAASNNLTGVNPQFANAVGANFQLQSGSPAIDAGMTISSVTNDFNRMSRPQGKAYDIGAYESGSSSQSPVPAPPTGVRVVSN